MSKTIEEILAPKPEARPRLYAYSIDDKAHAGLLKVGQTTRDVKQRVAEQLKTANIKNYKIELDEVAERDDGTAFTDHEVRAALARKGCEKAALEWMRCTLKDLKAVLIALRTGQPIAGTRDQHFPMRAEQRAAVEKTHAYFHSIWKEDMHAVPRFLWNAKMRFGKTFTTYQLARKLGAKRVLVVTFKPAVEDAWLTDLESHVDFDGWQYQSRSSGSDPTKVSAKKPLVYFGSFQDLLGRDDAGNIKAKNEWLHKVKWDLVVFDEYHFGAWRETAKQLFEGEEEAVAKKEAKLEYAAGLEGVNEDLTVLSEKETEFLPITTKAYLYLSGTPFKALATGEFIEEQIFNWTYTDEQRAKEDFEKKNPAKWNPYGALPQMRLLTYQMPDELVAIASAGEFDEFDLNAFFEATGTGVLAQFKHKSDVQKWLDIIRGGSRVPRRLGKPLPLIPFVFHGPRHSRPDVDRGPLGDIISVNLDHYRLDADFKHGLHFTALPTAWVSGFDKGASLRIGSSTAWVSETPGANAGFLEFKGQGLETFERAMDRDERLMTILGSRMLEEAKKVGETATAIELRQSGEYSILGGVAFSVSESLTQVLRWVYWWNSTEELPDDVSSDQVLITLNNDFSTKGLASQDVQAIVAAWQAGAISQDTMHELFRRGEVLPEGRTNEEEAELIEQGRREEAKRTTDEH